MTVHAPARKTLAAPETVAGRMRSMGWVGLVLGVYALTRISTLVVVLIAGRHQIAVPTSTPGAPFSAVGTGPSPGYSTIMTNWDGQWYRQIVMHGYPTQLPHNPGGKVEQNAWAFFPLFPLLVGVLMWITGLGFTVVGPTLALVLGAAAMLVMYRLVADALGGSAAILAVVFTCTFVSAPVFQAAYTESLALLLVCSCLLLLRRRHYGWTAVVIVLLSLSRSVVLPMSIVIVVHGVVRWRARADGRFTRRHGLTLGGLALLCVGATGLWPAIAAVFTGDRSAYTSTSAAWGVLHPFAGWTSASSRLGGTPGLVLFLLFLAGFYGLLASPAARRWGPELWGWAFAYPTYLVLATSFFASSLRYLLLAFPLGLLLVDLIRWLESRTVRTCMTLVFVCAGLAMQWYWIVHFFLVTKNATVLYP